MILWDTFIESAELSLGEGALSKAEELYLSALEEVDSDGCTDLRAIQTLQGLCEVYFRQGRQGYAKPYLERLSRLLDQLSGVTPEQRVGALQSFASLHEFSGDLARAEATWRQILKLIDSNPGVAVAIQADTSRKLAMALLKKGQEKEAEGLLRLYWDVLPDGPDAVNVLQVLAGLLVRRGQWAEADVYLEPLCRRLPEEDPALAQWRTHRARSLATQGKFAEAVEVYEGLLTHHHEWTEDQVDLVVRAARAAFEIGKTDVGERLALSVLGSGLAVDSSQRFALLIDLQRLALLRNDEAAAQSHLRNAISLYEAEGEMVTELVGPEVLVQCYWIMGETEQKAHRWDEVLRLYAAALQLHLTSEDPSPQETVQKVSVLADLQIALERWDDAQKSLRLGIQAIEKSGMSQTPQAAQLFMLMGASFRGKNRLAQGEQLVKKALALLETHFGENGEQLLTTLEELSKIQKDQGDKQAYKSTRQRMAAIRGVDYVDEVSPSERLEEADLLLTQGDTDQAEAVLRELQAQLEARDGPEIIPTYRRLAALREEKADWAGAVSYHRLAVAWLQNKGDATEWVEQSFLLSSALSQQGAYEDAEILLSQLVGVASKLGLGDSAAMGRYKALMGEVYRFGGKDRLAEPALVRAVELLGQHQGEAHPDLLEARRNLAMLYRDQGSFAKAEQQLTFILNSEEKTFGKGHPDLAITFSQLGELATARGDFARAEDLFRQALELSEKGLGSEHPNVAATHNNLAQILLNEKRYDEAGQHLEKALELFSKIPGHPGMVHATANLGVICLHQGQLERAQSLLTQALAAAEEHFGSQDLEVAFCCYQLAEIGLGTKRFSNASDFAQRALSLRNHTLGREHPETVASLLQCALVYSKLGQPQRALDKALLGLRVQESALGPDHPELAQVVGMLGDIYFDLKLYGEAANAFERAIRMCDGGGIGLIRVLIRHSEVREQQGKNAEAAVSLTRALELRSEQLGPDHDDTVALLKRLARLHQAQSHWKEAEIALRKVLEIINRRGGSNEAELSVALATIAALYGAQGKATVAESLYKKAADTVIALPSREPLEAVLGQWERFLESHGRGSEVSRMLERYQPGGAPAAAVPAPQRAPLQAPQPQAKIEPPGPPTRTVEEPVAPPRKVMPPLASTGPLPRPSAPVSEPPHRHASIEIPPLPDLPSLPSALEVSSALAPTEFQSSVSSPQLASVEPEDAQQSPAAATSADFEAAPTTELSSLSRPQAPDEQEAAPVTESIFLSPPEGTVGMEATDPTPPPRPEASAGLEDPFAAQPQTQSPSVGLEAPPIASQPGPVAALSITAPEPPSGQASQETFPPAAPSSAVPERLPSEAVPQTVELSEVPLPVTSQDDPPPDFHSFLEQDDNWAPQEAPPPRALVSLAHPDPEPVARAEFNLAFEPARAAVLGASASTAQQEDSLEGLALQETSMEMPRIDRLLSQEIPPSQESSESARGDEAPGSAEAVVVESGPVKLSASPAWDSEPAVSEDPFSVSAPEIATLAAAESKAPEPSPRVDPAALSSIAAQISGWTSNASPPPTPQQLTECLNGLREGLPPSIALADSLESVGDIYLKLGEVDTAHSLRSEALTIREGIDGREAPTTVDAYFRLAEMLSATGRYEQSESLWLRIIDLRARALGGDDIKVGEALAALGHTYVKLRNNQAAPLLNRALQIYRRRTPNDYGVLSRIVTALGLLAESSSKRAEAISHYREALQIRKIWATSQDRQLDAEDGDLYLRLTSLGVAEGDLDVALSSWKEARLVLPTDFTNPELASLALRLGPGVTGRWPNRRR